MDEILKILELMLNGEKVDLIPHYFSNFTFNYNLRCKTFEFRTNTFNSTLYCHQIIKGECSFIFITKYKDLSKSNESGVYFEAHGGYTSFKGIKKFSLEAYKNIKIYNYSLRDEFFLDEGVSAPIRMNKDLFINGSYPLYYTYEKEYYIIDPIMYFIDDIEKSLSIIEGLTLDYIVSRLRGNEYKAANYIENFINSDANSMLFILEQGGSEMNQSDILSLCNDLKIKKLHLRNCKENNEASYNSIGKVRSNQVLPKDCESHNRQPAMELYTYSSAMKNGHFINKNRTTDVFKLSQVLRAHLDLDVYKFFLKIDLLRRSYLHTHELTNEKYYNIVYSSLRLLLPNQIKRINDKLIVYVKSECRNPESLMSMINTLLIRDLGDLLVNLKESL